MDIEKIIAVSWSDFSEYGCINCGCEYGYSTGISGGRCSPVVCGECKTHFVILADGVEISDMGFVRDGKTVYPTLKEHPRVGIPKHKFVLPDIRPEGGGEYWKPRGVGYDLSGFVKCREAGERIVEMVEKVIKRPPKSWLDYRPHEPTWIQVKIQEEDGFNLKRLCAMCYSDGIITEDRLRVCLVKTQSDVLRELIEWLDGEIIVKTKRMKEIWDKCGECKEFKQSRDINNTLVNIRSKIAEIEKNIIKKGCVENEK